MFHIWVALTVLATALNRSVWVNQGFLKIYPNQYVILVSESQQCRKSTAINIGKEILSSLPINIRPRMSAQKLTPEALIDLLTPRVKESTHEIKAISSGLLIAPELSTLIDKQTRHSGLLAILVDLYDCDDHWEYRTRSRGSEELLNVYCNLLAGSSPEYLRLSLPHDEIGGGVLARTIFVYQNKPKCRTAWLQFGEEEQRSLERLVTDLMEITKLSGPMEITQKAREWYENWYNSLDISKTDPALAPYYSKKEAHVLKIATLLSIAENDSMTIDEVNMQMALKILEENEKNLPMVMGAVLSSESGFRNQQVINAINSLASSGPKVTRTKLIRKLYRKLTSEELDEAINTLEAANLIKVNIGKRGEISYETIED